MINHQTSHYCNNILLRTLFYKYYILMRDFNIVFLLCNK